MSLEIMAMNFLRFEKRCRVALFGRTPRAGFGLPDVLGITNDRFLLEVEIKRTFSDFRANDKKPHVSARNSTFQLVSEHLSPRWPRQFWYLVPEELSNKIGPLVPEWAGLMRGPGRNENQQVIIVKKAPVNQSSARLTTRQMVELAHCMANQILSDAHRIQRLRMAHGEFEPYPWFPTI